MAEIISTNGKTILVDDDRYSEMMERGNWMAVKKGGVFYAARNEYVGRVDGKTKTKRIYLHLLLLPISCGHVDHINGNGLDNRIPNLRMASIAENRRNRCAQSNSESGVKGVYWHKQRGKWAAAIRHLGKQFSLGLYENIEDARNAYLTKANEIWSAQDNFRINQKGDGQ